MRFRSKYIGATTLAVGLSLALASSVEARATVDGAPKQRPQHHKYKAITHRNIRGARYFH